MREKVLVTLLVVSLWVGGWTVPASAAASSPSKKGPLPSFSLPAPKDPAERAYLGISGSGTFRIPEIKAKLVVIEVFSLY